VKVVAPRVDVTKLPIWQVLVGLLIGTALGIYYGSLTSNFLIGFALFILCLVIGFIVTLIVRGIGFKIRGE